ncbi:sigma-54-dependent transcriptional regulator [Cellvibrio japonicus]|uniref:PilR n=1 Tax=Cellvibrio japonicus (strain Ueda107) TaxID=498211 RepID=B3PE06_CELJU|nr:sigma-54 dependent transcriptional regulator [Cellvibrio japonicus]ACE83891.1 PilR [Cellvibrio japonicus Ueda107]QEI13489.1 sigma-54-dependent Fis family transcriptional regulator [Cellvibrio japonicus]QEI17063.1 sigma-54-dependent Fis family transcriptional regulator [Cellvibrio japonicus]QEI20641.1 sigma-54-dependent Fis family transcriptional regulator [Cellvibrio japonicus]
MTMKRALIIDDEPDIRELLEITLGRMQITTDAAANIAQAKSHLNCNHYDLCLTDMRLPDGSGLELVEYIQQQHPGLPVAVITAHGSIDTAIESMKAGAFDFISKPVDLATLRRLVNTAIESAQLPPQEPPQTTPIIGHSKAIQDLIRSIQKLARSQAPVYISGESGSGKELVARSIHDLGPRSSKPFIAVNCGAIPRELMESEFFGHKKGSFTGAHQDKTGLFQAAEGGTLFFDEVADLPIDMQVKLLRAIQEKSVRPIGAAEEITTDVRILCATHKNLEKEVAEGRFRQDLFYRLNVIQLAVAPLRDRKEDIPLLTQHLLQKLATEIGLPTPHLSPAAQKRLEEYHFPGNVRELENVLERAFTLCDSDTIEAEDLQLRGSTNSIRPVIEAGQLPGSQTPARNNTVDYPARCAEYPSLDEYLQDVEKEILCSALEQARWNKTLAAKHLGISFRSLRYRLQKLGLEDE